MKQPSDSLIHYLVDDTCYLSKFKSQEDIEKFFGEPVPFTFEEYVKDENCFWTYLKDWNIKHQFKIIKENSIWHDRYTGVEEIEVIYLLDSAYYSIIYRSYIYDKNEVIRSSIEVEPVEKTIIEYVKKGR